MMKKKKKKKKKRNRVTKNNVRTVIKCSATRAPGIAISAVVLPSIRTVTGMMMIIMMIMVWKGRIGSAPVENFLPFGIIYSDIKCQLGITIYDMPWSAWNTMETIDL